MPLLQAALNGDRDHPAAPRTPAQLAAEARAAVAAGARSLHLHPYDDSGRQTLAASRRAPAALATRASVREPWHTTNMRSPSSQGQLILFPGADRATRRERPPRRSRVARKAQQLDEMAAQAEREAFEAKRAGDPVSARAARDRAQGARRAAELLRAGPSGVAASWGAAPRPRERSSSPRRTCVARGATLAP